MATYLERFDDFPSTPIAGRPPIVFVHGAYSGAWCWQPYFQPTLTQHGWSSTAFSLEGHAGSEGKPWRSLLGITDYVRNLRSIVKSLPEKPILIAHSMGGFVVQQYLERGYPAAGVIFLASVPREGLVRSIGALTLSSPDLWASLNFFQFSGWIKPSLDQFKRLLFSKQSRSEELKQWTPLFHPESTRALMDLTLTLPLRSTVNRPDIPIKVMGASEDKIITPSLVESTAQYFNVQPDIVPNCGHMMMLDHARDEVLQRILTWLDTHWPQPTAATAAASPSPSVSTTATTPVPSIAHDVAQIAAAPMLAASALPPSERTEKTGKKSKNNAAAATVSDKPKSRSRRKKS